jgi:hypothetical protein
VHRVEVVGKRPIPVIEDVTHGDAVGDAESEVQVGEAVAFVKGERAHDGSGYDALIFLCEPQQAVAEGLPLLNGEHEARSYLWHGPERLPIQPF